MNILILCQSSVMIKQSESHIQSKDEKDKEGYSMSYKMCERVCDQNW